MKTIRATWHDGQIVPDQPVSWPEGARLEIREEAPGDIRFMTEEEQNDDPQALQLWMDELRAVPPLPMTPQQEAEMIAWRRKAKEFNLKAVGRQMEEGIP